MLYLSVALPLVLAITTAGRAEQQDRGSHERGEHPSHIYLVAVAPGGPSPKAVLTAVRVLLRRPVTGLVS